MSAQQERVSFPLRVLFTLFVLDVGGVVVLIRYRLPSLGAVPIDAWYFEAGLALVGAIVLAALVWMWWRPLRTRLRPSLAAGGTAVLLGLAAATLPAEAAIREALEAYDRGNYAGALAACKERAEHGDASCQNMLGVLYRSGHGVVANQAEAVKWFRLAAAQGHPYAAYNLAYAYEFGLGASKSYEEAERWYLLAAKQHIAAAEFAVGTLRLRRADGEREALKWFRQAAKQGFPPAEFAIGFAYEFGKGVKRNLRQAAKWYLQAAQAGDGFAQSSIARLYERGQGIERDAREAYFWYLLATKSSSLREADLSEARAGLGRVKGTLTREQIAATETEAASFRPEETPHSRGGESRKASGGGPSLYATGSGFFVATSGLAVTNNHVVAGCAAMRITEGERSTPATVVATDPDLDLALVKLPHPVPAVVVFRDGPTRLGESVVAMGFPLSGLLTSDVVITTGIVSALAGMRDNRRELQISAPIQPGNSGGPLLDASGHLVGVVVARLDGIRVARVTGAIPENVNFAIKGEEAKAFLRAQGVAPATAASSRDLPTAEIAELAVKFTVRMECWK